MPRANVPDYPIEWFRFRGGFRRIWRVALSTPEWTPILHNRYAITVYDDATVYVDLTRPLDTFAGTMMHEIGHVALEAHTLPRATEERFVEAASGGLVRIACQLGMRFPPLPHEVRAMRRRWLAAQRKAAA